MNKKDIIDFFDKCAPDWDAELIINDEVVNIILDKAAISKDSRVLDVACGTGVLFPYYIERGAFVTGIDISGEMVSLAKEKFPLIDIICGDAQSYDFSDSFDAVMIYNAFPHFDEPEKLFKNLAEKLNEGGRFTVAHGMSRVMIEKCHNGSASRVSVPLPEAEDTALMMRKYYDVDVIISDDRMYMVSGVKK